ncbi:glycosyltransferase family 2 protein [Synoicihabitans lomoniglobus]|uniref:Glycosyltransferase family 2 protein n=1 Tax=Synoicihabitans lomoniglobus TaxID=2909285 RepID=A0AAE9ZVD1_9BACT|nr:glycosyltransferase family 2 protein [Opitutaceae bacterium LMO-M01]WED65745.1 glycosyltransferase family 2 protein [Opitutaceae bacterium LMO-M01]
MEPAAPTIAVVMPVFNEEAVLPEVFQRLTTLFDAHPENIWRAILVDDGSRDGSNTLMVAQTKRDARFESVVLTRNFGFQAALAAGLSVADQADATITLDADLQDPPELIPALIERWREGAGVVLAVRKSRQETGLKRLGMDLFHATFAGFADSSRSEQNTGTFGLMSRKTVQAFNRLPERNRFFPGLRAWVSEDVAEVTYDRQNRAAGQPKQTLRSLVRYALDGVFSFSRLPLRLVSYLGLFIAVIGFSLGAFYAVRRLIGIEHAQTGFTTLVTLVLFLGGVQLIGIGVLGEYLGRIYDEVKQRPLYLVKHHHHRE